jgi:hypothetical protein
MLLYPIIAFFQIHFEVVQVRKFDYKIMVASATHNIMYFDKKYHTSADLLIETQRDSSFAEKFIRCLIINCL